MTLNCEAAVGNPEPRITWTKVSDNSVVTFPLVISRRDQGYFRCSCNNGVGNPATKDVFVTIGARAGGARGAAAPPKFGQLRFFGQQEKIWAKPVFKDVSMFFIIIILKR